MFKIFVLVFVALTGQQQELVSNASFPSEDACKAILADALVKLQNDITEKYGEGIKVVQGDCKEAAR